VRNLDIDITGIPPTSEDLAALRREAETELTQAKKRYRRIMRSCVFLATAIIAAMVGDLFHLLGGISLLGWFGFAGLAVVLVETEKRFNRTEQNVKRLIDSVAPLSPQSHPEECIVLAKWCEEYPEVEAYRAQVAVQGRSLVAGEHAAALAWIKNVDKHRANTRRRQEAEAACQRLSQPAL
jgi:hypothetical protein